MIALLRPIKALPAGQKRIRLDGAGYVIRQIQPADFPPGHIPTCIANPTAFQALPLSGVQREMMAVVAAGVVRPRLVPIGAGGTRGREAGVTIEDLFRVPEHGKALFVEIAAHSQNPFRPGILARLFVIRYKWRFSRAERAVKNRMRAAGWEA